MGRIVALDIGSVRIGVAVSDPLASFANAVAVLQAKDDWIAELKTIAAEYDADTLLIGMPARTDGSAGPEAARMKKTVEKLRAALPSTKIIEWDERFTTVIAQQALLEGDISRRDRKNKVDKVAAAILLQSYLDHENNGRGVAARISDMPVIAGRKQNKKRKNEAYD